MEESVCILTLNLCPPRRDMKVNSRDDVALELWLVKPSRRRKNSGFKT